MKKYFVFGISFLITLACKNKKPVAGNQNVGAEEFFNAYNDLKLPFNVSDTNMLEVADTNTISYAILLNLFLTVFSMNLLEKTENSLYILSVRFNRRIKKAILQRW
jgi:hypothetical protein